MSHPSLRAQLVRLAHANPELRPHLLPILAEVREASDVRVAHGPIAIPNPDVMLYMIDPEANNSKFYEMAIVPFGRETRALKTKDWAHGAGSVVLMRRWGRLTDVGGVTGRVDSMNDIFSSEGGAWSALDKLRAEKTRKGYQDVSRTKQYPIGLGGAGFGWGGQAACDYIPELRELQGALRDLGDGIAGFETPISRLERRRSSIAPQLKSLTMAVQRDVSALASFLSAQLSECRA